VLPHNQYVRQAFEDCIQVLGERTARILVEDLRRNGVFLTDPYLTLDKIALGLKDIIGFEATEVIIQRVMIKLDEFYSSQMNLE
jgi:hypothetical protein